MQQKSEQVGFDFQYVWYFGAKDLFIYLCVACYYKTFKLQKCMPYLLVQKVENKLYLQVETGILVFSTKRDLLNSYSDYIASLRKGSAFRSMTLLALQFSTPIAIIAPENGEDLMKYFLSPTLTTISGGVLGTGFQGQLVSDDILTLKADFDLHRCILEEVGLNVSHDNHILSVDRDTFDALTEGRLGRYEDFRGTMEDLKTWWLKVNA